jgi:hypothetical protein
MGLIASALGLFYMLAAGLALRALRSEWFLDKASGGMSLRRDPEPGRLYFVTAASCIYGMAGIALMLKSVAAVWLLVGGLLLQGLYYGWRWCRIRAAETDDAEREKRRKAWNAAMISAAAFAFSAYAARYGVLT